MLPLLRRHACLAGPPANTCSRNKPSKQTATAPLTKPKSALCVVPKLPWSTHPPTPEQSPKKKTVVIPESPPQGGASHRSCGCAVAKRLHGRGGAGEAPGEFFHTLSSARPAQRIKPSTLTTSCSHSRACERIPQNKKLKPLVLPLPRRHAWLAGPPANTCSRNRPQNKRQQRPPTKPKTPRAVTLWRHACLTTPVVKPSLLQISSAQMATTPKPSSFRTSFRASGRKMSGISAARRGLSPELRLRCREATAREGWRWRSSRGILSHPQP